MVPSARFPCRSAAPDSRPDSGADRIATIPGVRHRLNRLLGPVLALALALSASSCCAAEQEVPPPAAPNAGDDLSLLAEFCDDLRAHGLPSSLVQIQEREHWAPIKNGPDGAYAIDRLLTLTLQEPAFVYGLSLRWDRRSSLLQAVPRQHRDPGNDHALRFQGRLTFPDQRLECHGPLCLLIIPAASDAFTEAKSLHDELDRAIGAHDRVLAGSLADAHQAALRVVSAFRACAFSGDMGAGTYVINDAFYHPPSPDRPSSPTAGGTEAGMEPRPADTLLYGLRLGDIIASARDPHFYRLTHELGYRLVAADPAQLPHAAIPVPVPADGAEAPPTPLPCTRYRFIAGAEDGGAAMRLAVSLTPKSGRIVGLALSGDCAAIAPHPQDAWATAGTLLRRMAECGLPLVRFEIDGAGQRDLARGFERAGPLIRDGAFTRDLLLVARSSAGRPPGPSDRRGLVEISYRISLHEREPAIAFIVEDLFTRDTAGAEEYRQLQQDLEDRTRAGRSATDPPAVQGGQAAPGL